MQCSTLVWDGKTGAVHDGASGKSQLDQPGNQ